MTIFIGSTTSTVSSSPSSQRWPEYRLSQVRTHTTREHGVWVLYQNKVYDISGFVDVHPGGSSRIMQSAGQDIEPFWQRYQKHYTSAHAQELLKEMQIGVLHPDDVKVLSEGSSYSSSQAELSENIRAELFQLRREVNIGALFGALTGCTVGAVAYLVSQKVKQLAYLKWSSKHRTAAILIGGALGATIGAFAGGRLMLASRPEIGILLDASTIVDVSDRDSGGYRKIQSENNINKLQRIEESFARRSEALDSRRKQQMRDRGGEHQ